MYASKKPIEKKVYDEIMQALCSGNKGKACLHATRIVAKEAQIDDSFVEDILASLNKIRTLRGATLLKTI